MVECLAVQMRQWINCLQETWYLTQMFIVTIMWRDIIMEMGMVAGKISMAVQEIEVDANEQV